MPALYRLAPAGRPPAAVQVADVLGDTDGTAWVEMLTQRALSAKWQDSKHANDMLCSLLHLPAQLLKRVLGACVSAKGLDDLLAAFPLPLHPFIIAAAASSGSLQLPKHAVDTFLTLLAATPIPPPSLLSLRAADASLPAAYPTATAALLARALAAHPSLTTLKLDGLRLKPSWIRELSTSLSTTALPNLAELCISTDVHPCGCAELGSCLKNLPALTSLDVRLRFNKVPATSAPTLATYIRSASSPAQLSRLHRLMFVELHDDEDLSSQPQSASCVHLLLPLFRAPALTYMRFASDAAVVSYPALLRALRHFTSLQLLYVDAELREDAVAGAPSPQPLTGALAALQKIDIKSGCAVAPLTLAAAAAGQAGGALTSLSLQHLHIGRGRYAAKYTSPQLKAAWGALLPALSRCGGLRQLDLDNLCGVPGASNEGAAADAAAPGWTEALATALSPLTALTRLALQGVCEHCSPRTQTVLRVLRGEVFGGALRALTALQSLYIRSGTGHLEFEGPDAVLGALPDLTRLTSLGLCFHGVQLAAVADVVPKLRALEEMELRSDMFGQAGEEDLDTFATRFPEITVRRCGCEK